MGVLFVTTLLSMATVTRGNPDPCVGLPIPQEASRSITNLELASIADIGRSDPNDSPSPLGISPDGKKIALVVRRGNPKTNSFCQQLLMLPVYGDGLPTELDRGGEFIRSTIELRGIAAWPAGYEAVTSPRWSPDGQAIAYLKKVNGLTQIWLVSAQAGGEARQVSHSLDDIEDFRWSADGGGFIIATRPGLRIAETEIDAEAAHGFLYDERFVPMVSDRPLPLAPIPVSYSKIDINGRGGESVSGLGDSAAPEAESLVPPNARLIARNSDGMMSWTVATRADRLISPTRLVVERADHSQIECRTGYCEDVRALWWKDESNILFIAKTGWARSETSVYRWNLDKPRPELVVSTADVLIGCMQVDDEIICAREGAVSPRRIVALNDVNGSERVLFAPNSGLTPERLGSVSRLRFTNDFGVQSYADLVLPPGHRRGEKHPLIVVQYNTDGFLRGGTGDEVPIQVLAGRGFAVLSFSRPDFVEFAMKSTNEVELRRRNRINWTDRRNVQSSLEKAIRLAVETGSVDEDRMGISGFSDGSSTTQWALINSSLFRVASLGACCVDRVAVALNGGPGYATYLREMGHPAFDKPDAQFWAPISLVQNVDKIDVPILVQAGDTEYEMGLDTAEAFRSRGKAFELYVFPDEPHYKWQPAHRLAMYDRVVDWFSFWLLKQMDCSVEKRTRYARWTSMPGSPAMENLSCHDGTG